MSMKTRLSFGELETAILNLISKSVEGLTVLDVQKQLKKKSAYTTILTVISRLYEKGVLKRTKSGRSYLYSVKKSPLLKRLKSRYFNSTPSEIFCSLLEDDIDKEELEKIEKMLEEHKKKC